jgi:tyrosine-specific transport protein
MALGKFLGSVLIIVGTSIGGGMLALPIATAAGGFSNAAFCFILCWLLMSGGAYLILELLKPLPIGSNMISLARHYLGKPGEYLIWFLSLALLYSLISAYISGGTDIFQHLLQGIGLNLPMSMVAIIYTLLFSMIVHAGIRSVDYVNRGLMFAKLGTYLLLVVVIAPFVKAGHFYQGQLNAILPNISILITSFGFAAIVPSLRDYWNNDIHTLKKIIFWGSIIPLLCYLLWIFVIMGACPDILQQLMQSDHAITALGDGLMSTTSSKIILRLFDLFSSVCMLTAFLNVALGLNDFVSDGFNLSKAGKQSYISLCLTFLPPLLIVVLKPGIYLLALNYAGIFCILLQLLLPVIMRWRAKQLGSSHLKLAVLGLGGMISILLPYFYA